MRDAACATIQLGNDEVRGIPIAQRGAPLSIRCDNGPELTSRHFLAWAIDHKIELVHIQPGKPTQNAYVESFDGKLREECLRVSWFQNLFDARKKITAWRHDYNYQRPHSSLNYRTPAEFAAELSYAKVENAFRVSHFHTATAATGSCIINVRKLGAGQLSLVFDHQAAQQEWVSTDLHQQAWPQMASKCQEFWSIPSTWSSIAILTGWVWIIGVSVRRPQRNATSGGGTDLCSS